MPGDLDHPWWVEDAEFDLEYHVRHIALPKPGDWRQFCIQAARLHARPLDLSRPLWELYVIEGLDGVDGVPAGRFAIVLKVHHAAIDGKSGVEMITAIHTQDADVGDPPPPATPWRPSATRPGGSCRPRRASTPRGARPQRPPAGRLVPGLGRALPGPARQSERPADRARARHPLQRPGHRPPGARRPLLRLRRPQADAPRGARGDRQRRRASP